MKEENIILTLSDGSKYIIVKEITYQNQNYLYLINTENASDQILCEINKNKIKKITDLKLVNEIILKAQEK